MAGSNKGRHKGKEAYRHLYKTIAWERLRSNQLQEEPFCAFCLKRGLKVAGEVVDHIKPHKGDWFLFHDPENIQTLCKSDHDSTKQRQESGVLIIHYGPDGWPIK